MSNNIIVEEKDITLPKWNPLINSQGKVKGILKFTMSNTNVSVDQTLAGTAYINSFALNPENIDPSGTVNMSRINNSELVITTGLNDPTSIMIYALNYNFLKIKDNKCYLQFIN